MTMMMTMSADSDSILQTVTRQHEPIAQLIDCNKMRHK